MKNFGQQLSVRYIIVLIVLAIGGIVISCSPSQKESQPQQVQQQIQALQSIVEPEITTPVTPVQENNPVELNQPAEVVIMNPPHGEPFHLCEVPVGSPISVPAAAVAASGLNNTSVTTNVSRTGTAPTLENAARLSGGQINTQSAQPLATSAQPRLNPPHGEPFHRCDIAVGSPLPVN